MGARVESSLSAAMTIRRATRDDLDDVFDVLTVRSRAAFGEAGLTREHLAAGWERQSVDRWVAVEGARVVGFASLDATHDVEIAAPDADVGDALLERVAERARERAFDRIHVTAVPEDRPLSELVQRGGFELEREIWRMWRPLDGDLPEPRWDGVAVRTYRDDDAGRVHALVDDAYGGWDASYVPVEHEDWLTFMTRHDDFDPELWFLAERDGDLVGAALNWKENRGDGWVKDIVVRESERGRGLGKALLHHAFREYARRGAARVGLKVDSTNPTGAAALYERVGFVIDRRYGIWTKQP